jgi:hypothetical protein
MDAFTHGEKLWNYCNVPCDDGISSIQSRRLVVRLKTAA